MASTVTLNGGPTGGLHGTTPPATPTSPSGVPPSPTTHRGESNSSFDSGQEESLLVSLPPGLLLQSPPGGHGKKRRKQSRPVRIPADDKSPLKKNDEVRQDEPSGPLNLTADPKMEDNNSSSSEFSVGSARVKVDEEEEEGTNAGGTGGSSSFSLFPRHPFTSLFPGNVTLFPQQQTQQGRGEGGPASSASSVGSNNSCGGGGLVVGTSSALGSLPPHRIFNPEAYCDLCNKEFCNKYFLKTHKANKHGVYSELSSPSTSTPTTPGYPPAPSLLQPSPATSSSAVAASSSSAAALLHHHHHQLQHHLGPSSSAPPNLLAGLSPTPPSKAPPPATTLPGMDFGPFQGSFGSSEREGGGGRKSFCELCQKEFCNKYFLKRHKAKIHGIVVQENPSSASSGRSNSSSTGSNQVNTPSVASTSMPKRFANGGEGGGCNNNNNNNSSMRDNNGKGGFSGGGGGLPLGLESLGLEVVTKHLADEAGREDGEVMPGDDEESSKGGGEGMKDEGVLQCQFCFREFSSRSLLASHLAKKHRLLVPTTFPPFLLPFPGLFPGGGGGGGGSSAGGGEAVAALLGSESAVAALAAGLLDTSNGGGVVGGREEGSFECEVCHRSFATGVLLRMHKSYFHPEARGGANSDNEEMKDEERSGGSPGDKGEEEDGGSPRVKEEMMREDADSDDLRRLQTMIMELNRVSSAGVAWTSGVDAPPSTPSSSTHCILCNKEFYSSFFLQQHIAHYHSEGMKSESPGGLSHQSSSTPTAEGIRVKSEPGESPVKTKGDSFPSGTLKERLCGDSQPNFLGSFGGSPSPMGAMETSVSSPATPFLAPGPKGSSTGSVNSVGGVKVDGKRPSPSLSRSYCTICHKELCNKYFMRTHMLKMHGISIESSTGLGGVTCDICNKELCSKYFLKVHKQNTHGIVEEGPSPPAPPPTPPVVVGLPPQQQQQQQLGLNLSTSSSVEGSHPNGVEGGKEGELGGRYFYHYSESCPLCGRRFRSSKWLKTHLTSDHGEEGREKWKALEKSVIANPPSSSGGSPLLRKPQTQGGTAPPGRGQQQVVSGGGKSEVKSSRNGDNKGPSPYSKGHSLTRDGNRCGFCNFSSSDLETMKSHLLKEHAPHLSSANSSRLEAAAMNAAALNAAALNAVAAAAYPGTMGVSSSVGGGGLEGGGSVDPLSVILSKIDGASNKLYRCTYCPFTTSILVYLYAHERTHSGGVATPSAAPDSFMCPMCFHTFDQPETLQQHLIGHQMSGVLGGFFTPPQPGSSSGRLFGSPAGHEQQQQQQSFLPLLNGSGGESLYWALKQNLRGGAVGDEVGEGKKKEEVKKRRRVKCSACEVRVVGREELRVHMRRAHGKGQLFRCRKCKFTSGTYLRLVVHSRVAHHHHQQQRVSQRVMKSTGTGTEWKFPLRSDVVMQGFLLTSSEEESSEDSPFVPSLVYLPVREKGNALGKSTGVFAKTTTTVMEHALEIHSDH